VINEAIWAAQGVVPVVGVVIVAGAIGAIGNWCFQSDAKPLLHGYVDNTGAAKRWSEAMRPKEAAKLRAPSSRSEESR
jgi:hypothetical protein